MRVHRYFLTLIVWHTARYVKIERLHCAMVRKSGPGGITIGDGENKGM